MNHGPAVDKTAKRFCLWTRTNHLKAGRERSSHRLGNCRRFLLHSQWRKRCPWSSSSTTFSTGRKSARLTGINVRRFLLPEANIRQTEISSLCGSITSTKNAMVAVSNGTFLQSRNGCVVNLPISSHPYR